MEPVRKRRQKLVKELRGVARACGAEQVRDDVGREKVKEMFQDINTRKLSDKQKAAAEKAFKAYEETWPTSGTGVQKVVATEPEKAEASPQPATFRLRGTSFLFTYNWDFFQKAFPDGSAGAANCEELWKLWVNWEAQRAKELGVVQSTSTLERSLHTSGAERVHFHEICFGQDRGAKHFLLPSQTLSTSEEEKGRSHSWLMFASCFSTPIENEGETRAQAVCRNLARVCGLLRDLWEL